MSLESANLLCGVVSDQRPWENMRVSDGMAVIVNPSDAVLEALSKVGDDDPAVLLDWDVGCLERAVQHVNAALPRPHLPAWLHGQYPLTVLKVQQALMRELAAAGSGSSQGMCLLAPNSQEQYTMICFRIRSLCYDAFMAELCGGPERAPVAHIYVLADRKAQTQGVRYKVPGDDNPNYVGAFQ